MRRIVFCLMIEAIMFAACESDTEPVADPREKFQIYLCFGQSNMQGAGTIATEDREGIDERFQVMASDNVNAKSRVKGQWYTAVPPLCGNHGLGPVDYFGRTLTEQITDPDIKVGAIVVAVGGAAINLFYRDYDAVQNYLAKNVKPSESYITNGARGYDNYLYGRMVEMAQKAQETGVIKGILLHQGEAGWVDQNGQQKWGDKLNWTKAVKEIYDSLLADLDLEPNSVPLLAGQVVADGGNGANTIAMIDYLPTVMPDVAYVIDSKGLTKKDNWHFDSEGYRGLGKRYAEKMLELLAK